MFLDEGLIREVKALLDDSALSVKVRLFTGGPTITNASVWADFTEATFSGYAAISAAGIAFPTPTIAGDGAATTVSPLITFTAGGGIAGLETITGIMLTVEPPTGGTFGLWAELFGTPVDVQFPGDTVEKKITVKKRNY